MVRKDFELSINKRGLVADFSWLNKIQKVFQDKHKINKAVSIALLTPAEIRKLNKVYRHQDKVTDVLSFTLDSSQTLGEVVICLSQAKKQAKEKKVTLKKELQLLTVHGILHLLGYDHEKSSKEFLKQQLAEQDILKKIR